MKAQHRGAKASRRDASRGLDLGSSAERKKTVGPLRRKAWAGNGLVSEDHAAGGGSSRWVARAALALVPGQAMAS